MTRALREASGNAALHGGAATMFPASLLFVCLAAATLAVISMVIFNCGSSKSNRKSPGHGGGGISGGGCGGGEGCDGGGGCGGGCGGGGCGG